MSDDWMSRGLCAQTDPEAFFPAEGRGSRVARRVCGRCEVRAECLDYALSAGLPGIWGGTTGAERRDLRAARNRASRGRTAVTA